jgi:phosphatidylglycerol:prolipoprotein diacylglycerol transferase
VLFYDLDRYLHDPAAIFAIWTGGMSFHGGMLGVILEMVLFARSRGIHAWSLLDTVAAGVPVGLGVVRLANFINSELWGRVTDVPWGVVFPNGGPLPRHPSQVYEALLEGVVLFAVLWVLVWKFEKLKTPRFVGGAFIAGYGLARIFVEFFRVPDAQIGYLAGGWLTMGMVLSLPMVLAGAWAMVTARPAVVPVAP